MNKYKYKSMNTDCKHDWDTPIGEDETQFCKKCGSWKSLKRGQEK